MRSQHCGYWCPGAKAPGHQYSQYWLNINLLDQFHMKILHFCWTTFGNKITHWKKWPSRLRVKDKNRQGREKTRIERTNNTYTGWNFLLISQVLDHILSQIKQIRLLLVPGIRKQDLHNTRIFLWSIIYYLCLHWKIPKYGKIDVGHNYRGN